MTTLTAQAGIVSRRMLAVVAVAGLALSLALTARPVHAADTQVGIHQQLPIASETFKEDPDCGDFTTGVVWHFILNKYDGDDAQLFATFADAGAFGPIDPADKASNAIHFYINTPDDDSLVDAWVILGGDASEAQLQLSHVCHTGGTEESVPPSEEESVPESVSESVPESGEQSVEAGVGTPAESTPDGALSLNGASPLPTIAFSLILLASLGALAYANVQTVRNR